MRIIEADIVGFGKFENQQILFDSKFQLFFGNNEGGKSTLFQFIQAILFGFPKKGKYQKDYAPKNGTGFGGHLFLETKYGKVKVTRFKEDKEAKVYLFDNQTQGGDKLLKEILDPLTRESFLNVYSFQENQLEDKHAVTEEELQQQLLLFGLTGSEDLLAFEKSLNDERQKIFKKNGRQPQLNKKLVEYEELSEQIEKQKLQESRYQVLIEEIKKDRQEKITLKKNLEESEAELNLLRKQKVYQPLMKEWESLKEVPSVTFLKEDLEAAQEFYQGYEEGQREIRHLQLDLKSRSGLEENQEEDYLWYKNHLSEVKKGQELFLQVDALEKEAFVLAEKRKNKEEQLQFLEKSYGFSKKQPPQNLTQEKKALVEQSFKRLETEKIRLKSVEEKTNAKKAPATGYLFLGIGILCFLLGFFLPGSAKGIFSLLGIFTMVIGVVFLSKGKSSKNVQEKEELAKKIASWEAEIKQIESQLNLGNLSLKEFIKIDNPGISYQKMLQEMTDILKEQQQVTNEKSTLLIKVKQQIPFLANVANPKETFFSYLGEMEKIQFAIEKNDVKKVEETLLEKQKEILLLEEEAKPVLTRLSLTYLYEVPQKIEKLKKIQRQNQRRDEIYPQIKDFLQEGVLILKSEEELVAQKENWQQQLMALTEREQTNKAQADFLVENGTLEVLLQEQANLKSELEMLTKKYVTNKLMESFIGDLSRELSEQSLPNLLAKVGEIFKFLTYNRYSQVFFYQDLLQVQDKMGVLWSLKDLSTGTKDQLLFAFRFAFILLQGEKNYSPIVIDDGWLRYDRKRKEQFLKILTGDIPNQIILLSSDEEMKNMVIKVGEVVINLENLKEEGVK